MAASLTLLCCSPGFAQHRSVALTFDDLPIAGDEADAESMNRAILDALARHSASATGFVIATRVQEIGDAQGREILWEWVKHGHDLGNHTFSHADFNELTLKQMEQEILLGDKSISPVLRRVGRTPRYFRFPMNHTGDTTSKHKGVLDFLAQHGYSVAACTVENEDFLFNAAYLQIKAKNDLQLAIRLRADYLAYTSAEIDYYAALNKQALGYEPPQVMVLHVNRLNADVIEDLLRLWEQKQYTFVPLDQAQSDPSFAMPDTFVTPYGPMWGYRWAAERGVKVNGALEKEPPAWVLAYAK
jgi:peptidoglycan/xylan/chitin deacetylase (PgdA/CDA1 family)